MEGDVSDSAPASVGVPDSGGGASSDSDEETLQQKGLSIMQATKPTKGVTRLTWKISPS